MAKKVMGQTGRIVLSDDMIKHKASYAKTVRYRYVHMGKYWRAEVIGPFHSKLYGACSIGTKKTRAKAALKARLSDEYGYHGCMLISDVDAADNVGTVDQRLLDDRQMAYPITLGELIGSAGQ